MTIVERLKDDVWMRIPGLCYRKRKNALKCVQRLSTSATVLRARSVRAR